MDDTTKYGEVELLRFSRKQNDNISALQTLMQSFEQAKGKIISSALGKALGMISTTPLADVAAKIMAVVNRGALNWSASNTTHTVLPGYYTGGTLDSRPAYSAGYNTGYNAGKSSYSVVPFAKETKGTLINSVSVNVPAGKTRAIIMASAMIVNHELNNGITATGGSTVSESTATNIRKSNGYCCYSRVCNVVAGNVLTITASNTGSTHEILLYGYVVFL